ncbi:AMP-dependent synthetase and ligase, acyl-CoA synthase [Calothrix parasitica NIES-267]|uniref:AMP-dependent synthetase and ligase, acyl-CoA synthase n=1 Tax=Calothrix parasitica NIES-267 TaxID=1973488 RepID=A0A1Z4LKA8_9CYAN|nr:AMP-dependent synthetase and ligase, acyl-CoA synthase [Calothrix parasitica NIES-267]
MSTDFPTFSTIVDLMQYRSNHQPEQQGYIFLADGESQENSLSYKELDVKARLIAAHLQSLNMIGERALLLYPPGLEFIAAFLGCLYAGVIAVPAYPPRKGQSLLRVKSIGSDSQAAVVLTTQSLVGFIKSQQTANLPNVKYVIATDSLLQDLAYYWQKPAINSESLAFLQYTSGSTGNPKGVMVSHANLLHNEQIIKQGFGHSGDTTVVGWLPFYHDMGLIGNVLQPLYLGICSILMPPVTFLQKPIRWLKAISDYKATTSGAPNFAYEMCLQKITSEQRANLDLSSWEVAFCGAETIRVETLERFAEAFAECGFRKEAFYPCYGLAEATLFVTGGEKTALPKVIHVDTQALAQNRIEVKEDLSETAAIVSCGRVIAQEVAIVNPDDLLPCDENEVGEVWVTGESIAQGYWGKVEETAEIFKAKIAGVEEKSYLRTGDLGFLQEGELYITGRIKDTIIIRGLNYYPQDIELTVEQSHPSLQFGYGAAFGVEIAGKAKEEGLVIVQEVKREGWRTVDVDSVIESIRAAVSKQHQLQVYAVLLLKPGSIPKTTSGKVQRYACRAGFENGGLNAIGEWRFEERGGEGDGESTRVGRLPTLSEVANPKGEMGRWGDGENQKSRISASELIVWLREYAGNYINSRLIDERRCVPPHIVLDFGNRGLLGMQVPREYGGLGLGNYDTMRVLQQLGAIDTTLSLFVGLNNILGIRPILRYGSKALQDELLPILATGRELAAFAITEPGAGSNPQGITSQAIPDGDGWRLSGTKIWSGSAAWAGVTNVFVQHQNPDGTWQGISGFAVRKGTGMRQGKEALTMGMRGMVQNTIYLNDVTVGGEQMLGQPGAGMHVAQDAMMYGRLAIAAASVGGMKRCTQLILRYSSRRSVSTGKLLENPFVLKRLSEITAAITATENLVSQVARRLDAGEIIPTEIYTACKTTAPEFYWQAADSLVQVLGGRGYIESNIAPQILRDARILRIFEGPTETLNMFLGSRAIHESESLTSFISESFQAPEIAEKLQLAAIAINKRTSETSPHPSPYQGEGETSPQSNGQSSTYQGEGTGSHCVAEVPSVVASGVVRSTRWAAILTGEITTFAILWGALHQTQIDSPSELISRAIEWVQFNFEEKLKQALLNSQPQVLSSEENAELISSYINSIGDIEQTLPGEDWELDEFLRQEERNKKEEEIFSPHPPISPSPTPPISPSPTPPLSSNTASSIQNWLINWLSQKLKISQNSIDINKSFADYGIDSVIAVELAQDLQEWLNYPHAIEATIAWNFPTIESLSNYLAQIIQEIPKENKPEVELPTEDSSELESMSDVELAQLLAAEISAVKGRGSE